MPISALLVCRMSVMNDMAAYDFYQKHAAKKNRRTLGGNPEFIERSTADNHFVIRTHTKTFKHNLSGVLLEVIKKLFL